MTLRAMPTTEGNYQMGLVESLSRVSEFIPETCTLAKIVEKLPGNESDALAEAIDSKMTDTDIWRALKINGYKISSTTVGSHRRKVCACYWGVK